MRANAISRPRTQPDPPRSFSQARAPRSNSVRRWQTPEMGLDFPDTEEVTGSNPVRPTPFFEILRDCESRNESQPPAVLRSFRTAQVRPSLLRPTEDPHRRFGGPARSAPSWWLSSDLVSVDNIQLSGGRNLPILESIHPAPLCRSSLSRHSLCSPSGQRGSGRFRIQRIRRKARLDSSQLPNNAVAMTVTATNITMRAVASPSAGCITPTATGAPAEVIFAPTDHQGNRSATTNVALPTELISTAPVRRLWAGATDRPLAPRPPNRSKLASLIEHLLDFKSSSKTSSSKSRIFVLIKTFVLGDTFVLGGTNVSPLARHAAPTPGATRRKGRSARESARLAAAQVLKFRTEKSIVILNTPMAPIACPPPDLRERGSSRDSRSGSQRPDVQVRRA